MAFEIPEARQPTSLSTMRIVLDYNEIGGGDDEQQPYRQGTVTIAVKDQDGEPMRHFDKIPLAQELTPAQVAQFTTLVEGVWDIAKARLLPQA